MEGITALLGVIAAAVGVVTGIFGVFTYFRDSRRRKRIETLEAYKALQVEVFGRLNDWKEQRTVIDAVETADSVGYAELNNSLARIEHFCVGINRGIYDFETFYQMAHGYFDYKLQRLLLPLLDKKLNKYEDSEDFYNNLHKVWDRMKKRSKREL
ncbi:MAG: hypothetical protein II897_03245 [Clostridia bacterium]|nr:hypothetical protein [Clostridia bacterium]